MPAMSPGPLPHAKPVADDARAARKQGCLADSQGNARGHENSEACNQAAGRLRERPTEEPQPEEPVQPTRRFGVFRRSSPAA